MIEGVVKKLSRDINTDLISSSKYFSGSNSMESKLQYTLYDYDPSFGRDYRGEVLVVGANFGCGSSREIAAQVFKAMKTPAIVADSFARTFYRNAINIGLPVFEVAGVSQWFEDGEIIRIDEEKGELSNVNRGRSIPIPPFPAEIIRIIRAGGLLAYIQTELGNQA